MKKISWLVLTLAAAAAVALRVGQMRAGFNAEGLPIRGNVPALLLPVVLALAAAYFVFSARKLPAARGENGLADVFRFAGRLPATVCGVAGAFALLAASALALAEQQGALTALLTAASALCLLYVIFALYRGNEAYGAALLVPACALAVYLIVLYRADAPNPVLARIYVELLAVAALTFAALELAAFAFGSGSPRVFVPAGAVAAILALTATAEQGGFAAALLFAGCALVSAAFLAAATEGEP